ncbi:hypothetical protein EV361DRAFT_811323 [Lentinula raphanica]|nr:hypothetical protein EV361DRAFT_811323 [Lentinula raphanica]
MDISSNFHLQEEEVNEASDTSLKVAVAPEQSNITQSDQATVSGPETKVLSCSYRRLSVVDLSKLLSYPEDALQSKNASAWFPEAFKYVNVDLSDQYLAFVQDYIAFEGAKNWSSSPKGLPARDRPKELTRWIAGCRYERAGSEPKLKKEDLECFSQVFMAWWTSLKSSSLEKVSGKGKKPSSLNISGKNGWLSVVACIKWWGMALGEDREGPAGGDWRRAISDVHLTLKNLLNEVLVD